MRPFLAAVSTLLIALSLSAAALVPGPEKAASQAVPVPTPDSELPLAVATDGRDYVVVWTRASWTHEALYAAKVTEAGVVSPMPARRITGGTVLFAWMVWTDDAYLLVWSTPSSVMAARLDRDANVITEPFVVSSGSSVHALAWDGRRAVAITNDNLGMKALVLGPAGNVVSENRLRPDHVAGDVRLVAAGGGFVLVWAANFRDGVATVHVMRLSRDGEAGTRVKLPFTTSNGVWLDAKADGDRVGIAYTQWPSPPADGPLRPLRRYTVDAQTLAITGHPSMEASFGPEVVVGADGFLSAILTPRGGTATLEATPFESTAARSNDVEPAAASDLRTASNGRSILAVWTRGPIAGAVFDLALTHKETPVLAVSTSFAGQRRPELAPAGDIALHTWIEGTTDGPWLMAARVDRLGNPLDVPRRIATGEWIAFGHDVVFAGKVWLVAYQDQSSGERNTFVRRIGLDGVPLDEAPLDIGYSIDPVLASNGDVTLLAVVTTSGLRVHRFSAGGMQRDPSPLVVSMADGAMASNGREFLFVDRELRAMRFGVSGNPIDAAPFVIDDAPANDAQVRVASDGTGYAVVFQRRTGPDASEMVVKRVLRTGVLDGSTASGGGTVIGRGFAPRIAFLGTRAVVAYDSRLGTGPWRLYLTEVGGEPLPVAESNGFIESALVSRGNALWLSYARVPDPEAGIPRVFVRAVDDTPPARRRTIRK